MTNDPKEQAGVELDQDNIQSVNAMQQSEEQSIIDEKVEDTLSAEPEDAPSEKTIVPDHADPVDEIYIKNEIPETDASEVNNENIPTGESETDSVEVVETVEVTEEKDVPETEAETNKNEEEETPEELQDDTADQEKVEIDYSTYSREEMVEQLRNLIDAGDVDAIRDEIDAIKFHFYKKLKTEQEASRQQYVDGGGVADDYVYEEDAQELILKNLQNKYRELRNAQNEKLEAEKLTNLEEKLKIIEELKDLTSSNESIGDTFQIFRELQNRWRAGGLVPQSEVKNLWDTYHHYVEIFYDYIKINKELRDLDFKRNLEAKIDLCEKAESLLLEDSVVNAFHTLQNFHDQWREIGPVPQEMRVEIWERFKAASTQINKKHQEHFETLKETQKQNLEAKQALCEKVEEISQRPLNSMLQWEKNAKEIIELQKLWNTLGYAAKKDNAKTYKQFHTLCDRFFNMKREFFSKEKTEQVNNLQLKEDLCVQAEALKDSTEWKTTTEDMINLQKRWREIGSVPSKHRETIWKRFRSACDQFFENKSKHFSSIDSEYDNNLKAKKDLIERVKSYVHSESPEKSFEQLKEFQREWSEIGFVPIKFKKKIQEEYRSAITKQFDSLKLNENERNILRYKTKIENLVSAPQSRGRLDAERDKLVRKYQQLQSDLIVWENNIGFFSKSKNSEAMIANVERMIEQGRTEMKELEDKIRMIDNVDEDV